ncbi:cell division protein FtsL [Buchnera aphidicola]|uniref:cell division protein FtsL n=1 Tax=Buchnera aphidicola TaxID=9 RepID=UPI003BEEE5BB
MKYNRYDLPKIIQKDLFLNAKIHLILLVFIILSANLIIITNYNTQLLIIQKEKISIQKNKILKNDIII